MRQRKVTDPQMLLDMANTGRTRRMTMSEAEQRFNLASDAMEVKRLTDKDKKTKH